MTVCRRFDCRNEFESWGRGVSPKQFCSGYCRMRWHRTRNEAARWVWATLECPTCGVGFSTRNAAQVYCTKPCWEREYRARPEFKEQRRSYDTTYYRRHSEAINARERRKRARRNRCECGLLKLRSERQCQRCAALPIANEVLKW